MHGWRAILLVALCGGLLASCGKQAPPPGGYTLDQVRRMPEVQLADAGAQLLAEYGNEARPSNGLSRPSAAFYARELGVQATPQEVEAFYDQHLRALGWGPKTASGQASGEGQSVSWSKGNLTVRFATQTPGDPRNLPATITGQFATVYRIGVNVELTEADIRR